LLRRPGAPRNDGNTSPRDDRRKPPVIRLLGALGKDGADHIAFFRRNGIDTKGILVDKRVYNATGTVITDMNDNQIWGFYYGASMRGKDIRIKDFVDNNTLFVISANHPDAFLHFQKHAIEHKIDYMYDVGMALSWIKLKDLRDGVAHCKWLVGNDYEIALIEKTLKTTVKKLVQKGITVITTLGEKGVRYESKLKSQNSNVKNETKNGKLETEFIRITIPAFTKKKVVDPTGAGDAWRGGFVAGVAMGLPVVSCLKLGNSVASMAVEKYGTVNYTITKKEVLRRVKLISQSSKVKTQNVNVNLKTGMGGFEFGD